MKIHHLNCTPMAPRLGGLVVGEASRTLGHAMVCHCLLVETDNHGLVLVDSGFGLADVNDPKGRVGQPFLGLVRPDLREQVTAIRQIEAMGFKASDVQHIVLTHMDIDHAGGLSDFPQASVHVYRQELETALKPLNFHDRQRYRSCQWAHGPRWQPYDDQGEAWFGFNAVRNLEGLPPEILLVPLTGHSAGHAGVGIDTGADGWLLHCGDAYFHRDEMHPTSPSCPLGLRVFQSLVQADKGPRLDNQKRLRSLVATHGDAVRVFSAHDAIEWEQFAGVA